MSELSVKNIKHLGMVSFVSSLLETDMPDEEKLSMLRAEIERRNHKEIRKVLLDDFIQRSVRKAEQVRTFARWGTVVVIWATAIYLLANSIVKDSKPLYDPLPLIDPVVLRL